MMKRREFTALLGGAAVWPLAARAQQGMPVIGFLGSDTPALFADRLPAFREGLGEMGYVEGRNLTVEYRWADGQNDRLPGLAADLVRRRVNVIAAASTPAGPAAKLATTTIPIVFVYAGDPVAAGLVASLPYPGGNLTGVTGLGLELVQKQMQLLKELAPTATLIAVLINPTSPTAEAMSKNAEEGARSLGVQTRILYAATEREFEVAFATLAKLGASALVIAADVFFTTRSEQLAVLAMRHALPTIATYRQFATAGGLITYGTSLTELYRTAGNYIGRILKGEKAADLPVQRPTKVEMVLNLKAARALGLTVPLSLRGRADEVIE